jgi:hypothetical protein
MMNDEMKNKEHKLKMYGHADIYHHHLHNLAVLVLVMS